MADPVKLLVICTGNRWRSPILEHLIQKAMPTWDVRSRGTRCGHPGMDVPKTWRACVDGWTEPHSATLLTSVDMDWCDIALVVQQNHVAVAHSLDKSGQKTVWLYPIPDPAFIRVSEWPNATRSIQAQLDTIIGVIESLLSEQL